MDWRTKYADKLRTTHDAAKLIESGNSVYLGMFGSCPEGLAKALYARHPELTDVRSITTSRRSSGQRPRRPGTFG